MSKQEPEGDMKHFYFFTWPYKVHVFFFFFFTIHNYVTCSGETGNKLPATSDLFRLVLYLWSVIIN